MFELVEDEVNICEHDLRWCTPTGWHTAARGVCAVCRIAGTKTNAQSRGIRLALLMRDPNDYVFPTYAGALSALIARADLATLSWVGTSMGGLLGIVLAGQPGTPVGRLVVNDVGPILEPAALQRIGTYVGANPVFATFADLEAHIRFVSAPFGALTDAQWRHLSETTARALPDGRWALRYDPGIAIPMRAAQDQGALLWSLWDAITCPTLLLRGAQSDLLTPGTAREMTTRGPRPALVEFPRVGHAPMLLEMDQIAPVAAFLRA